MAVPGSGELSLLKIAKEKLYGNYDSASTVTGPISLKDVSQGGNASGFGVSFDVTNGFSPSHPNNEAAFGMQEFYGYDHDYVLAACNIAYYEGDTGTFTFPINLGSGTGIVRIEYQAYGIPDKFVFTWNGNTYTSGVTSGNYDGYVGSQLYLSALRNAIGNQSLEITSYTTSDYNPVGTTNEQGGGRYFIEFNKKVSAGLMTATVSAPLSGTAWWFSVSCPGQQVIWGGNGVTPSVQTNAESNVGASGFTMNGETVGRGLTSNYSTAGTISARGFVYKIGSTSTPFLIGDSGVTNQQVDTSNSIGSFSHALTGLSSGTTYSYRAYATNAAGTTYSSIKSATTGSSAYNIYFYIGDGKGDSYLQVNIQGTDPNNNPINVYYTVSDGGNTSPIIAFKGGTTVTVSAGASGFAGSGGLNGYAWGSSTSPYNEYDSGSFISISNSFTITEGLNFDIYTDYAY